MGVLRTKIVKSPDYLNFMLGKEYEVVGKKVVEGIDCYVLDFSEESSAAYDFIAFPVDFCKDVTDSPSPEDIFDGLFEGFKDALSSFSGGADELVVLQEGIAQIHELDLDNDPSLPGSLMCSCGRDGVEVLLIVGTVPMYLCRGCVSQIARLGVEYLSII